MIDILVFIFGLLIGSFLNVCIYRIPKDESIIYPGSHCGTCNRHLKPIDLIPTLSYILLSGRCRYCSSKISVRYPMVEFLTGIIFLLFYKHFGLGIVYYFHIVLISSFICIAFIDYDHQIIPDELILFGFTLGIGYKLVLYFWMEQPIQILNSIWGLLLGGGFFLLIAILSNGGMGGGDIKLMAMVGFWFGWKDVIFITFFSFVIGSILSIILLLMKKKSRKDAIPFGPFIVMATLITMLYKEQLLYWYWRHFFMNH